MPFFASQPLSWTRFTGDNATFSVTAVNVPPLTYQWFFNNAPLIDATNATLTFTNISLTLAGRYQCVASNFLGTTPSQPATLTVLRSLPLFESSGSGLLMTPGGLALRLKGLAGSGPITLYASSNLLDWFPILTNPPVLGSLDLLDRSATNAPSRFYRAVEE
jgi:hypothetical protein